MLIIYIHIYASIFVYEHIYANINTYIRIHIHIYTHMYAYESIRVRRTEKPTKKNYQPDLEKTNKICALKFYHHLYQV